MNQQSKDPSPAEIAAWCQVILSALPPDERQRRLRVDLRPMVSTADGRRVSVTADAYEAHMNGTPFAMCVGTDDVFLKRT